MGNESYNQGTTWETGFIKKGSNEMKKLLSSFIALVMLCTSCITAILPNTAYAIGTADDIVSVATGEIGTKETGTNTVKYWDELGYSSMQGQSW